LLQYLIRTGKNICPRREFSYYGKSNETGNDSPALIFGGPYPAIRNIRLLFLQILSPCIFWKVLLIQGCGILIIDGSKELEVDADDAFALVIVRLGNQPIIFMISSKPLIAPDRLPICFDCCIFGVPQIETANENRGRMKRFSAQSLVEKRVTHQLR